jgi:hypothetical protein
MRAGGEIPEPIGFTESVVSWMVPRVIPSQATYPVRHHASCNNGCDGEKSAANLMVAMSPSKGWPGGGTLARLAETLNDLSRPGVRMGSR